MKQILEPGSREGEKEERGGGEKEEGGESSAWACRWRREAEGAGETAQAWARCAGPDGASAHVSWSAQHRL